MYLMFGEHLVNTDFGCPYIYDLLEKELLSYQTIKYFKFLHNLQRIILLGWLASDLMQPEVQVN